MMLRPLTAVFLAALGASFAAGAEPLTLSECVQRARTRSLGVRQSALARRQADAALKEARGQSLPQLLADAAFDGSDDKEKQLEGSNHAVLRVEQTVTPLSASWLRVRQQSASAEAAALSSLQSVNDAELAVKELYFSIAQADEALRSTALVEEQLSRLQDAIVPRFSVGRVPHFDVIKVKVALSDLKRSAETAQADRAARRAELAQLIGEPADADLRLAPLSAVPALPDSGTVLAQLGENPSLRALSQQVRVDELGVSAARRARLPDVVTAFEYGPSGTTAGDMTAGWDFTMGLRLPLYAWGSISAKVAQQQAAADLSRTRRSLEEQRLLTRWTQVAADAEARLADQRRMSGLVAETRQAAMASIDQYRKGAMGILETTDALNLWLQTLLNERGAYYAYLADAARLENLSGGRTRVKYEE